MDKKFSSLLFVLAIFIIAYPTTTFLVGASDIALLFFGTIVPLAAMYAVSFTRERLELTLSVGVPYVMATWFYIATSNDLWLYTEAVLAGAFYLFVIASILQRVYAARRITQHILFGAVSVYVLLGIMWSHFYYALERIVSGSFINAQTWGDFLYYSFVTLTTLGNGDIVPYTAFAHMLTITEAVVGVLFIAVLISQLVGTYSSQAAREVVKEIPDEVKEEVQKATRRTRKKTTRKTTPKPATKKATTSSTKKAAPKKRTIRKKAAPKKTA